MRKANEEQHAIIIPFPAQGHINPMLQLAKLLHSKYNFYITFVHTISYQTEQLDSHELAGLPRFRFESITYNLPPGNHNLPARCQSIRTTCIEPFRDLVARLNREGTRPPVTCIVADGVMSFTMKVAKEFGIREVAFWTMSGCGYMAYVQIGKLIDKGLVPLQDASKQDNGYMDTPMTCLPAMKNMRLKDLPSFIKTTNPNDFMLNFMATEIEVTSQASAIILNTFESLEHQVFDTLSSMKNLPRIYSIGPLDLLVDEIHENDPIKSIASSLWNEQQGCIDWLNLQEPNSVVYLNFGSIVVMTMEQLSEFAWGLANSKKPFLWVIRPNLLIGNHNSCDYSSFPSQEFVNETKDRSLLVSWCPQKEVLKHESIGGFLTHSGWNSTLESIFCGVPMICWPFSAEQPTNCRYCCVEWEIGMEIEKDVVRGDVEKLIRVLMEDEKGKEMKKRAIHWQCEAQEAVDINGSSKKNLDEMVKEVLVKKN